MITLVALDQDLATLNSRSSQTYLIVSHRPSMLEQADQIIVLDRGHVAFCGPFQDLPLDDVLPRS